MELQRSGGFRASCGFLVKDYHGLPKAMFFSHGFTRGTYNMMVMVSRAGVKTCWSPCLHNPKALQQQQGLKNLTKIMVNQKPSYTYLVLQIQLLNFDPSLDVL